MEWWGELSLRVCANSILLVSGYGLAVANAQHDIAELVKILKGRGIKVR